MGEEYKFTTLSLSRKSSDAQQWRTREKIHGCSCCRSGNEMVKICPGPGSPCDLGERSWTKFVYLPLKGFICH